MLFFFKQVKVVGVIKDFYGFPDFKPDARYYCITNHTEKYLSLSNGISYSFSDDPENTFIAEKVFLKKQVILKTLHIYYCILSIILFAFQFAVFHCFKKNLCLPSYYKHLCVLGKRKISILSRKLKDIGFFLSVCLTLQFLVSIFFGTMILIPFFIFSLIIVCLINLFIL